ncbi:MAG TPA: hypothetical protein VN906_04085 [Candidatus Sulfotelmatobacter sp.]|nr:hypothetical protein [Candidatus Sulfotelmatobacter sp.]
MIRLARREARACWGGADDVAIIATGALGFAGAAEDDRRRWLNAFRRLLDGLDAPLQVVIDVQPGCGDSAPASGAIAPDLDDMRGADMCFVEQLRRSPTAHRFSTSLATLEKHAARLEAGLQEMGISLGTAAPPLLPLFGQEVAGSFRHVRGFSRSWYVHRLPGTELEPGWLFHLLPQGLALTLAWHATPLPAAWIVGYLQRQLINMRATQIVQSTAGTSDPSLDGALPNAEDLQRRLASSQDKAFHVSVYLTLTAATRAQLELGSRRVESAARAILATSSLACFGCWTATLPRSQEVRTASSASGSSTRQRWSPSFRGTNRTCRRAVGW